MTAPMPEARAGRVSFLRYLRLFRRDILSAQPAHLYRAKMAEFRTPFFTSFLLNEPDLVEEVLKARPADFPKSGRVEAGLRPLLGRSVFLTNGTAWERQRRIIDPAFGAATLSDRFPAILGAAQDAIAGAPHGVVDIEPIASKMAADVIFRSLFSKPISESIALETYAAFQAYQRAQPMLTPLALWRLPGAGIWHKRGVRRAAAEIRGLIRKLVDDRLDEIASGTAPDDLGTALLTKTDPDTGTGFSRDEMVDQVAIFYLAGHETSAAALSWSLYLLAKHPGHQARVFEESRGFAKAPNFRDLRSLPHARNVFRETLRLYPSVPMMVREATRDEAFRNRPARPGTQLVLSPWHMHRNERLWRNPHGFDPDRWTGDTPKGAYLPFSAGPRTCPGAGLAMAEGVAHLALIVNAFEIAPVGPDPVPVAHLTVRSRDGIRLRLRPRAPD